MWERSGWGDNVGTERGRWLTCCGGEDDQSCPVVLDELAHGVYSREFKPSIDSESSREELVAALSNCAAIAMMFDGWSFFFLVWQSENI